MKVKTQQPKFSKTRERRLVVTHHKAADYNKARIATALFEREQWFTSHEIASMANLSWIVTVQTLWEMIDEQYIDHQLTYNDLRVYRLRKWR